MRLPKACRLHIYVFQKEKWKKKSQELFFHFKSNIIFLKTLFMCKRSINIGLLILEISQNYS